MGNLKDREARRRGIVGSMIEDSPASEVTAGVRGRPREDRELKKRVSLSVLPSLYEDIQRIAYVQRRSTSDLLSDIMKRYRDENIDDLLEYDNLKKHQ